MIHQKVSVKVKGSAGDPTLTTYIIDYSPDLRINERPLVLICPGGGYGMVSDREGELLALQYTAMGFHAAVLRYSTAPAEYPVQLLETAKSMVFLREKAQEWHIESDKIIIHGSSAGGHLAASYSCFWQERFLAEETGCAAENLRPNGLMLNYPVITSGQFAHRDSFRNLLGDRYDELADKMSLENQVNQGVPKTFLWHTFEDGAVPVENSLLFVNALRKANIPVEFHLFPTGGHGYSLCNELTCSAKGNEVQGSAALWITLAGNWLRENFK